MNSSESVHHEVLPNGLTLLFRESHLAPVADIQIWAKVGSADETPDQAGLSHFHEHMLFKGTERRGLGEVAGEIEGAGGRVNAYTSFDVTVYYATLPSDALSTGLDVLVDSVRNSIFDPAEVDREIEVVLEEIRRSEDSPGHVLSDAIFKEHYREHRYGLPILGPAASVASFDRAKITDFWKSWYTPDNMVVVAAGDFDAKALAGEVADLFGDAEPGVSQRNRIAEPAQKGLRTVIVRRPFERLRLDLTWPSAAFCEDDATYLDLLSFILGECESSRLVRRVRESEDLVDRIDSSSYTPLDAGVFSINLDVDEARAHAAIRASIREVERIRRQPVGKEELDRARANFLASEHFERESVSGLASKLGNFHVLGGDYRLEDRHFELLRKATAEDLHRVANKYLDPELLTAGALIPESCEKKIDAASVEAAIEEGIDVCRREFVAPRRMKAAHRTEGVVKAVVKASSKASADANKAGGEEIHSYEVENGGQLHVLPRHGVPPESAGITRFLASAWSRGTRSRSAADFARAMENIASDIEGFSGRSSLGFTMDVATDQLDTALDLFGEMMLEPGLREDEIEKERRETLAALERLEDQLSHQAFALFTRTHFDHHPYSLPALGSKESIESFSPAALLAHHERLIVGNNLSLAICGDVDPDEVAAGISRRLAGMAKGESFMDSLPDIDPVPSEIRRGKVAKDRAQAHLVIGFRGVSVKDNDRYALELISQLLAGQSGRLFLELRDRRSLAYSVSAMNVEGLAPGFFAVYIATAPEKVEEARTGMFEELERLATEAPDDDELEQAKRHLIGNHAIAQQHNAGHAAHISLDALYGLGPASNSGFTAAIAAVEKEEVIRVAKRIIRLDAYTEALVEP